MEAELRKEVISDSTEMSHVLALLSQLHDTKSAEEKLVQMREKSIPGIADFLARPPEVIPQARVIAVRALGRIGSQEAVGILKDVLYRFQIKDTDPVIGHAESIVKNAIVEELAKLTGANSAPDYIRSFHEYRLPAAARAIRCFHLTEAIPDLIPALEDDVVAAVAAEALGSLGRPAVNALINSLGPGVSLRPDGEPRVSKQRRILAALTLGRLGDLHAMEKLKETCGDPDPTIAGTAASAYARLVDFRIGEREALLVLRGTLCDSWVVRDECREVATHLGRVGVDAALELVPLKSMPDLYGIPHPTTEPEKRWLVAYIIEFTDDTAQIERLKKECSKRLLYGGIWLVQEETAVRNLRCLAGFKDPDIRQAVAHVLGRFPCRESAETLIHLLGDWRWRVGKEAQHALSHFPPKLREEAAAPELLNPVARVRIKWLRRSN